MSLPRVRPERGNRRLALQLTEVLREMGRQDAKWGARRELLDVSPRVDLIAADAHRACVACDVYQIPGAKRARAIVDRAKAMGQNEWAAIALEELCEAIEAKPGRERRIEVVQTIAVLFQWLDNIDRRALRQRQNRERKKQASPRAKLPRRRDRILRRGDGPR